MEKLNTHKLSKAFATLANSYCYLYHFDHKSLGNAVMISIYKQYDRWNKIQPVKISMQYTAEKEGGIRTIRCEFEMPRGQYLDILSILEGCYDESGGVKNMLT